MFNQVKKSNSEAACIEIEKCARCGKCRSVCPVFDVVRDEAFVARGRIALAQALLGGRGAPAEIRITPELSAIMSACLGCGRCSEVCSSGVEFTEILKAARLQITECRGLSAGASFFFRHVLPRRRLFNAVIRSAAIAQRVIPGRRSGNLRHLPLLFKGGKWLPPLAKTPALQAYSGVSNTKGGKTRIALFVGCLINYAYPEIVGAAIRTLEKAGASVVVPSAQVCCGTPVLALGDFEDAQRLARLNQDFFKNAGCDYIITLCASCGRTLKQEYGQLLDSSNSPLGAPVLDISEFLCNHAELNLKPGRHPVTYHDPCHLRWGQGIKDEPRKLLSLAGALEETPGEMTCCGQAGSFHVFFPEFADAIAQKKLQSLAPVEASEVATACPGCMMQLNDLFARSGSGKKAVHLVEVLARSIE